MLRRAFVLVAILVILSFASAAMAHPGHGRRPAPANDKQIAYIKRTGAKFLKEKEAEEGVYKLESGMLFKILNKGTGAKSPTLSDDCTVHYTGTLRDGTKFDSSVDRGSPANFAPNQVIKGWTEALQLMREGDKWEVYIPYNLAYGESGSPPKIPGFSPLVFQMELISVNAAGKPASEVDAALLEKFGKSYADL